MNRLAKKCVIASGLMHGTLVVLLLVGPAFLGSNDTTLDTQEIIDFIPFKTLEQSISGGGNPNVPQVIPPATPPAVKPPQPEPPQPKPERQPDPEPVKPKLLDPPAKPIERNTSKPDPDSLETSNKPKISLKQVTRNDTQRAKDTAAADRARAKAEANKRVEQYAAAIGNISGKASDPIKISELRGPGGGGLPYAGFQQALVSAYMRAWLIPAEVANSSSKVVAVITVRRDGTVISSRIERRSGNRELDASVQRALDKVSFVAPLPDSSKGAQDTFWLEFDPKLKTMMS